MSPLRYVVLRHEGIPEPHFDLMFETAANSLLATWRASDWPIRHGSILTRLGDHRRIYLDFEGPLSNNRGSVHRIATGVYLLDTNRDDLFEGTFSDTGAEFTLVKEGPELWTCYLAT
jgi:hypothetical protein